MKLTRDQDRPDIPVEEKLETPKIVKAKAG